MGLALEFAHVSKRFTLQHERPESLQERFVQAFRRPSVSTFWALRDVSFAVRDGETFGILGRNGAGKSTLLKLATGILQPTSGAVRQHRRTYAMLELGAGFHPELTGRDNIMLNGSIHGLSRAQTRATFDPIVAFAELEEFIDTPVKHYSSGMYMRLGFATAIHMQPELLIIDEILAVGDAAFRRKCTDALWALRRQGVTILFVSHNEEAVYQFCDRALLLSRGHVAALGDVDDVVSAYARLLDQEDGVTHQSSGDALAVLGAAVLDGRGQETTMLAPGQPWSVDVAVATPPGSWRLVGEAALVTDTGTPVLVAPLDLQVTDSGTRVRPLRARFERQPLAAGRLRLHVRITATDDAGRAYDAAHEAPHSIVMGQTGHGPLLNVPHSWQDRLGSAQAAALPGIRLDDSQQPGQVGHAWRQVHGFAEVVTGPDQQTVLQLLNPADHAVQVRLAFAYDATSTGPAQADLTLAARDMIDVDVGAIVGLGKSLSVIVTADGPVLGRCLVTVYAYPGVGGLAYGQGSVAALRNVTGAHVRYGGVSPAPVAWFAEGFTGPGFETYLVIANPTGAATQVQVSYRLQDGQAVDRRLDLPARSRRTIAVHDPRDPNGLGLGAVFAARIASVDGQDIITERVTYCRYQGRSWTAHGVTASSGLREPRRDWAFAVGQESPAWDVYLAIASPSSTPANVTVTYVRADDPPVRRQIVLKPGERHTVAVHGPVSADNPAGDGTGASIHVVSDEPVLVERVTYVVDDHERSGPVSAMGAAPGPTTALTAGDRRVFNLPASTPSGDWRLVLMNPDASPVVVRLSALGDVAQGAGQTVTLPAFSRRTTSLPDSQRTAAPWTSSPLRLAVIEGDGSVIAECVAILRDGVVATLAIDPGQPDAWSARAMTGLAVSDVSRGARS